MPQDHIDYSVKNGSDALALTDHGNMNGFSYQYLHAKKLKDKGVLFKALSGVEAYYIPSLSEWRKLKTAQNEAKAAEKEAKRLAANPDNIGDELVSAKAELEEMAGEVTKTDEDEEGGTVVENEDDSKSNKYRDPIQRRNHLVLLAKNNAGLKTLFRLVSNSYIDGFYRYPRIDLDMLKREAKGNIIATSACLASVPMHIIASHQTNPDWNEWVPNYDKFDIIQNELKDMIDSFKDALGEENYYLELQFNRLKPQALLNFHLIEAAKRTNTKLVVTCDSHYSNPDHWRERELYKAMAWASKSKDSVDASKLPQRIEELKCELYPKNAQQMWDSYKTYGAGYHFYNDDIVRDAIERTWDIAHNQIGTVDFDRSVKLPVIEKLVSKNHLEDAIEKLGKGADEDVLAFEELKRLAKIGLKNRNRDEETEYIDRLVYELGVIKELKFAKYFLTYAKIMDIASKHMLIGYGRGSAAGSLLSYCLEITQVDPIKYGLLFERFLTRLKKNSYPDIDSDLGDREKAVKLIGDYFGTENVISVSNFNQLQLRSLIKDVARLAGLSFDEVNKYTGKIENEALAEAKKTPGFDRAGWVLTYEEAENNSPSFRELMEKYPEFEKTVRVLFKQMRNVSRHAGGVIITSNPRDNMPIIKSGDVLQTPWPEGLNARHLEGFGLLKFDILGLGTLRMFEDCIRKIVRKENPDRKYITFDMIKKWYDDKLHPDKLDLADQKVYRNVWWESRYAGVFQFINPQVQKFMTEMKPTNITDLSVATSIFRPGPLCLSAGTQILVSRHKYNSRYFKYKSIEQLYNEQECPVAHARYSNTLCSLDENTNTIVSNEKIRIIKSGEKEVWSLKVQLRLEGSCQIIDTGKCNMRSAIKPLKATLDHMFLTLDGWKPLRDLKEGDYLFMNKTQLPSISRATKNIHGEKNFRNIAFLNYRHRCCFCDWKSGSLDTNHVEGGRKYNNSPENLSFLCPNHHRVYTEGNISKEILQQKMAENRLVLNDDIRMVKFLSIESHGVEETYDIEMTAPHHNFFAGGLVVHNSIGADKLYLNNRKNPSKITYKHPLLKDVLESTSGLIIFQEQLQLIYNKLAGVPLEETDNVRKAFTKKDLSNKEKAAKEREAMREDFANRCLAVNNIAKEISYSIFDEMEKFVAYSFNKSHAVSYSLVSYTCAWLLTYYPEEWITTYIDYCATEKGKQSGKEDPKAIALSEAKALGFSIGKPDINLSEKDYTIRDGKLIPSFASLKHVGMSVLNEINEYRPYNSLEDLLFNINDTWRHSKFNKRAMSTLIKLEAFGSMGLVGEDKMFKNYRQLHHVLVDKGDDIRRAINRKKNKNHKEILKKLIEEAQNLDDFSLNDKIEFSKQLSGTIDMDLIITPEIKEFLDISGIESIDFWDNEENAYWAIVKNCSKATTKTGKTYLKINMYGQELKHFQCFCWNYNPNKDKIIPENTLIIGKFNNGNFGFSCFYGRIEVLLKK